MGTFNSRHNKPKQVNTKLSEKCLRKLPSFPFCWIFYYLTNRECLYIMANYVCNTEDIVAIKMIMSEPGKTKFVEIGDALLSNDNLACLTCDDGFMSDDINRQRKDDYLHINV
jgi:hypothetical protein